MDTVSSCREKLAHFRIKELKDVLTQLGLAKQGKKQDLVDRIIGLLSDEQGSKIHGWGKRNTIGKEGVVKIIDDTYRKMQIPGATDLASKSHSNPDLNNVKPKEEVDDSYQHELKIQCLCGNASDYESIIKCEESKCRVWQHMTCVILPEKPLEGVQPEIPPQFYCEICRLNKADPFWLTVSQPLRSVKLPPCPGEDGTLTTLSTERTFQLSRIDRELLQRTDYDLQVWCILLNDKVPFRMQWPKSEDPHQLHVNGVLVRTTNRPGPQLLGINGRDDGPVITTCSREGLNKICLTRADARVFCFGVRIARRKTMQQVLSMVPKESAGETFEEALARVRRCIGGGNGADNADSDSDLEVVADSVTVNLRCPMSGSRMKIAGRFKPCVHMGCFDLETFIELNQRSRKWQCPICLKNYTLENIIIDPYFNRITSMLQNCGEDVNEIDMRPDGSWRAKNVGEFRDLGCWHSPDGSPCIVRKAEENPEPETLKQVKEEGFSDGHTSLKLGIKRNRNGFWEVSKPDNTKPPSSGNHFPEKYENNVFNIPMSSSATGSYRDGEDPSVNQEGGQHFDFPVNNGHEFDSRNSYNADDRRTPGQKDADVIVLSDSEEDNVTLISPQDVYDTHPDNMRDPFSSTHPGISESYPEDPGIGNNGNSCMDSLGIGFGMSLWHQLPPCSQPEPDYQFFNTDLSASDALVNVQPNSIGCPLNNGYGLSSVGVTGDASFIGDLSSGPHAEVNGSLLDNPMVYCGDDPSLKIFLPPEPSSVLVQPVTNEHADVSSGIRPDDWTSLRLGRAGASNGEADIANGLGSRHQFLSNEAGRGSISENGSASLNLGMNDDRSNMATSNNKHSASPFSHPRQPRSVRPRLYLSIDSDST